MILAWASPFNCQINIFTHLEFYIATVTHNCKWLKITFICLLQIRTYAISQI